MTGNGSVFLFNEGCWYFQYRIVGVCPFLLEQKDRCIPERSFSVGLFECPSSGNPDS